jgi:hypothetical protein
MKATFIVIGIIVLLVSVVFFSSASSDLKKLDQGKDTLWGLGGVLQEAGDAIGVTNYNQQRKEADSHRNISIVGMFVGGILTVIGLTIHRSR